MNDQLLDEHQDPWAFVANNHRARDGNAYGSELLSSLYSVRCISRTLARRRRLILVQVDSNIFPVYYSSETNEQIVDHAPRDFPFALDAAAVPSRLQAEHTNYRWDAPGQAQYDWRAVGPEFMPPIPAQYLQLLIAGSAPSNANATTSSVWPQPLTFPASSAEASQSPTDHGCTASAECSSTLPQPQVRDKGSNGVFPPSPPVPDCPERRCPPPAADPDPPSQTGPGQQRTGNKGLRGQKARSVAQQNALIKRRRSGETGEYRCLHAACFLPSGEPSDFSSKKSLMRTCISANICQDGDSLFTEHMKYMHDGQHAYACGSCWHTSKHRGSVRRHCKILHPDEKVEILLVPRHTSSAIDQGPA